MRMNMVTLILPLVLALAARSPARAQIKPVGLFRDNMVLQQGVRLPVWGTAPPGDRVTVQFAGQTAEATVDPAGRWQVVLNPVKASAVPAQLTIADAKDTITVNNVLVGEVWVCSGQSNMEFHVRDANNAAAEIQQADFPTIRELDVGRTTSAVPIATVRGHWDVCSPGTVGQFSAAAYFFARDLWNHLHVPVGLINSSWGATMAEPWTPIESFTSIPVYKAQFQRFQDDLKACAVDKAAYTARVQQESKDVQQAQTDWYRKQVMDDVGQREKWYDPATDDKDWSTMTLPSPDASAGWNYLGSVWVRLEVTIPQAWVGKSLNLHLGACDDVDITYVNGHEVGRTWQDVPNFWRIPRKYVVPADLVTSTRVTIVVQVPNTYGVGGMFGTPDDMSLAPVDDATATPISLAGTWKIRLGTLTDVIHQPQMLDSGAPGVGGSDPAAIYNGMIAPLEPFAIKGVIWYQGESNWLEPAVYAQLFPALVSGWRKAWGEGDFPFYFVQLAQIQARQRLPIELESWGDIRDAQAAALALPHTGMAVITDVGDPADIHPKDKQDVGKRLALIALAHDYGEKAEYTGPTFKSQAIRGDAVTIKFDHAEDLHAGPGELQGFAIAGSDKVFHYARATIKGSSVIVTAADGQVPVPVAVRYNWGYNPVGTLTNRSGLPASQFRTDAWGYEDVSVIGGAP